MNDNLKQEILVETTERIVIEYANCSGRESTNRAEFRNRVHKILSDFTDRLMKNSKDEK